MIHALLKSTAHWDQHEDITHTHFKLLGLCCSGPMKTSHTWTSAVTLPGATLRLLCSYKSGRLASFPASILLSFQQSFSLLSQRVCSTGPGLRGEPFLRLNCWEVKLLETWPYFLYTVWSVYNWTENVIMEKIKRYIFQAGCSSCSNGMGSYLIKQTM